MKIDCPNSQCKSDQKNVVKDGAFKRAGDSRKVQRYRCKICGKRFSKASFTLEKYQKKRRINKSVERLLASGISLRRAALILKVNVKTVERRLPYLGAKARLKHKRLLRKLAKKKVVDLEFDDLITKENSKLKPLSVSIAVDASSRRILSARVSQIPAFGHLSEAAKRKYGKRKCCHKQGLKAMFDEIFPAVDPQAVIRSDEHHRYPPFVSNYFPSAHFTRHRSERGCVAGQGELKKVNFDPLFAINHTCAMFRANINRLIRKTWCTTKDPERLQHHIYIFMNFFNQELLGQNKYLTPI